MFRLALLATAATLMPLSAAAQTPDKPAPILTSADAKDVWTHARPEIARVTHIDLDLVADFTGKRIYGTATLDVLARRGAKEIVLDSDGLQVRSVTDAEGRPLKWTMGKAEPEIGAPFTIAMGDARTIRITYTSAPNASALQFLSPEQTAGKQKPYLFSQGQPINNRSFIPTQDSPGIRQTWTARLTVPADLTAVMSGERLTPEGEPVAGGMKSFRFRMDRPVPPYLITLAVGDLAFKSLGPRSGIYSEPAMLERAAAEAADVEKMIDAAEALYGPYRWGRYDMLVLPPAFPYGGMENPTLTFLTPTIITGDRSNTDVIAHELAHSWSGNLVTNATWSDSWLNEGFTTYFENRIMEALYGPERAAMYADLDWDGLQRDIQAAGGADAPATRLHGEPGATYGQLDYFKGSTFLRTIEQAVGRPRWDAYLRSYFDRHAFQPQTSAGFLADLRRNLIKDDRELEAQLQLDNWVYRPGLPVNAVHIESQTLKEIDAQVAEMNAGAPATNIQPQGWSTQQWLRFLNGLDRRQSPERLAEFDRVLKLSASDNAYVRSAWYELAIANRYEPAIPSMRQYLGSVGRGLLIRPLYTGLMAQGDWGKAHARALFAASRKGYHPTVEAGIARIVG